MEEFSAEFENLMIKGDLQEVEEQSIVRYLAGLRFKISKTVQLQPYNTLQDVIKLALKLFPSLSHIYDFFFWIIKNLLPKGQSPTNNQDQYKKPQATRKNEKRTALPLKT